MYNFILKFNFLLTFLLLITFNLNSNASEKIETPTDSGEYSIVKSGTTLKWYGEKKVGAKHHGIIQVEPLQSITLLKGLPKNGQTIKIDMNSIMVQDLEKGSKMHKKLMDHLRSKDFFNVKKFPSSTLKINNSKNLKDGKIQLDTELTIKNKTKPLIIIFNKEESNNKNINFSANFKIDRKKWELKYGSNWLNRKLDKIINDEIKFELKIRLAKK